MPVFAVGQHFFPDAGQKQIHAFHALSVPAGGHEFQIRRVHAVAEIVAVGDQLF